LLPESVGNEQDHPDSDEMSVSFFPGAELLRVREQAVPYLENGPVRLEISTFMSQIRYVSSKVTDQIKKSTENFFGFLGGGR
jgi:hypothetical protein